jgi:hypothetical protein
LSHAAQNDLKQPFTIWAVAKKIPIIGLYKVALGEDITKAETPGMFDLKVRNF